MQCLLRHPCARGQERRDSGGLDGGCGARHRAVSGLTERTFAMAEEMRLAPMMLVTGGSGSIGGEIAAQAAEAGWSVAVQGRRDETIAAALAAIGSRAPAARGAA